MTTPTQPTTADCGIKLGTEPGRLTTAERCIEIAFDAESRPSLRSFREWQARGWLPYKKIGRRTYFDPAEVRAAIDRRFTVQAKSS